MSGIEGGNALRTMRTVSRTNPKSSSGTTGRRAAMPAAVRVGLEKTGPGAYVYSQPSAANGVTRSVKRMAASTPSISIGIKVISVASSGVLKSVLIAP